MRNNIARSAFFEIDCTLIYIVANNPFVQCFFADKEEEKFFKNEFSVALFENKWSQICHRNKAFLTLGGENRKP